MRPPISVSRTGPSIARSMAHAEIGVDHGLIGLDLGRCAVGDFDAVIEHQDAIGQVHHHAHVVLDQRDGGAVMRVHVEDEARHVLLLLKVHAGHGLVEQQQIGLHGERTAKLDPLLQTIGSFPTWTLRMCWILRKSMISSTRRRCSISSASAGPNRNSCQKNPRRIFSVRPAMMLSSAVMPLNSATFWKVRAMPPSAAS